MNYDSYRYLWPPRPEAKIPPSACAFYERKGWVGQVKKNGTCTVIFSRGDEVIFKTRHNDDHLLWSPLPQHTAFFQGRSAWNVYVAELLHSKTPHIKNHLYLFDVLVSDGVELVGTTLQDRQDLLAERFPKSGLTTSLGVVIVGDGVSRAMTIRQQFDRIFHNLNREDEGMVFKNPAAALAACVTPTSNAAWQVKCRKPNANYSF